MSLHTTADDPTVYRDEAHVDPWRKRCPIARLETLMMKQGAMAEGDGEAIRAECDQLVLAARDTFRAEAAAKPREVFDHLYASMPESLARQQDEYFKRLDRKGIE